MLKFINGDGTECIPADTTAEAWHTLCGQRTVQLIAGKNIQFEDTDTDALMIATSFTDTPEHRYQQYIHSKQLAMAYGNERAGVTDVDYQFTAGYEGAIYAPGGHPYVKRFRQCLPQATATYRYYPANALESMQLPVAISKASYSAKTAAIVIHAKVM